MAPPPARCSDRWAWSEASWRARTSAAESAGAIYLRKGASYLREIPVTKCINSNQPSDVIGEFEESGQGGVEEAVARPRSVLGVERAAGRQPRRRFGPHGPRDGRAGRRAGSACRQGGWQARR